MSYVVRANEEFQLDGRRFRFIGMNKYPLIVSMTSQANVQTFFTACQNRNVKVVRTWCFDGGNPPSDSGGNFRFLDYPEVGDNLITNPSFESGTTDWTLGSNFTRVNEDAYDGTWSVKQVSTSGYDRISIPITVQQNLDYVLTFRYKMSNPSGFPPVCFIGTTPGSNNVKDGGFSSGTNGVWVRKQVLFNAGANTTLYISFQNWNGTATGYYDQISVYLQSTPVLSNRESTFQQLDMVLDEARQKGIRLILSLADNPTYLTKKTYCTWANEINNAGLSTSFPYIGFFTSEYCKDMYKDFIDILTSRVNTVNGRLYKEDDTIFSWELGNELRLDRDDPSGINTLSSANLALMSNPGGWIDEMSTYIKTRDPNHLVAFSSCSHKWEWVNGDTVANGTYYGVDYNIIAGLPYIDYVDFHLYPTQGGGEVNLLKYGQHLGYANEITGDGLRAQLVDYVQKAKANGKPIICGEVGFVREVEASNANFPLYPRVDAFTEICRVLFNNDADGVIMWHGEVSDGGTYSINLVDWNGNTTNLNYNDTDLQALIQTRGDHFANNFLPKPQMAKGMKLISFG